MRKKPLSVESYGNSLFFFSSNSIENEGKENKRSSGIDQSFGREECGDAMV
jgi:hypothetical protein